MSFRSWLRSKALEKLVEARRHHHAKRRAVEREVPLSSVSSFAIVKQLCPSRPSSVMQQQELSQAAHQALAAMSDLDREVLILRHGEGLANAEVAEVLGIEPDAASKRYGRGAPALRATAQDGDCALAVNTTIREFVGCAQLATKL